VIIKEDWIFGQLLLTIKLVHRIRYTSSTV
jgi:hypothetical protein